MSFRRIIPCLDVKDGRIVKGVNFINLRDAGDPVENARIYDQVGADELVFLDISASSENRGITLEKVREVARQISIPLTVGGGIRSVDDIQQVLSSGAAKVSINTAAVKNPKLLSDGAEQFGSQRIVLALDARKRGPNHWEVFINGGKNPTGLDVIVWALQAESLGVGEILLTSMDRDGTQMGYDIDLTRAVCDAVKIPVIASGGAGKLEHFMHVLTEGGADAALAASLFHDKRLTIEEVKLFLSAHNIPVRPTGALK